MEAAREALLERLRLRRREAEAGRGDVADDEADAPLRAGMLLGEGGDGRVGRREELLLDECVKGGVGRELEEARDEPRPDEPGKTGEKDVAGRGGGAGSGHKNESVAPGSARCYFAVLRRGRCFAETDWMMSLRRPVAGRGVLARAIAAARSASTSGRASAPADSRRMKRVSLPESQRGGGVGRLRSSRVVVIRPILLAHFSVNQRAPSGPSTMEEAHYGPSG